MIKQIIFIAVFYISCESNVKTFLVWFINNCSRDICFNLLIINRINKVRVVYLDIHQQDRDFLQSRSDKNM